MKPESWSLPLTLWAAAALTSASQSFSKLWKAGTRSVFVISGPTAFCSWWQNKKLQDLWGCTKIPHQAIYTAIKRKNGSWCNEIIWKYMNIRKKSLFNIFFKQLGIVLKTLHQHLWPGDRRNYNWATFLVSVLDLLNKVGCNTSVNLSATM